MPRRSFFEVWEDVIKGGWDAAYDPTADVLYVKRARARIATSREVAGDPSVVLNLNRTGEIVGLQLIEAHDVSPGYWARHRGAMPRSLHAFVDRWLDDNLRPAR